MRFLPKPALVAALLAVLALWPARAQDPVPKAEEKERYNFLQERFVCQCGCSYNLLHCPHLVCPSAPVMRQAILNGMRGGQTDEQVVASMVGLFGEVALAQPTAQGFNLVGWVMPFVALIVGLVLLQAVVRSWRKRATAAPSQTVDPALLERYRGAIEQEIKELEE